MKQLKIFIGVVPDVINEHGGFDMICFDQVNKTQERHPIVMGDNARVITINENTLIAFEHTGAIPQVQNADIDNVLQLVQLSNKSVDNTESSADNDS